MIIDVSYIMRWNRHTWVKDERTLARDPGDPSKKLPIRPTGP